MSEDWVTVKIRESVRDQASDDPRTYTGIMRAGLETNPQVDGVDMNELEVLLDEASMANEPTADVDLSELVERVEKLMELVDTTPTRTADKVEERLR